MTHLEPEVVVMETIGDWAANEFMAAWHRNSAILRCQAALCRMRSALSLMHLADCALGAQDGYLEGCRVKSKFTE